MILYLHIGMGKTGTSAIQKVLDEAGDELASQKAAYLGMWFEMVHRKFAGPAGFEPFFAQSAADLTASARALVAHMQERSDTDGTEVFVHSNEAIFDNLDRAAPFIAALKDQVDLRIVLYVRGVRSWLPSAYLQWGVRHKINSGPVPSFADMAPELIARYRLLPQWRAKFGDVLTVRSHARDVNVIEDFGSTIGLTLTPAESRFYERSEDAVVLLRAMFNNMFENPVLPEKFNRWVLGTGKFAAPSVSEGVARHLDFSDVEALIDPHREFLTQLEHETGLPLISGPDAAPDTPDMAEVRARLLDHALAVLLKQSVQMSRLERRVRELESGGKAGKPGVRQDAAK